MNIHTYEVAWLAGALVLIIGFIATITYGSVGLGITMIDDREETIAPDEIDEDERFGDPRVEQVGEDEYDVYVVAMTFIYQPGSIEVPADSTINFYVTSRDVIHSFTVVGTNTNTMVIPGEISVMTVEFEEPGEYGIVCNEYCGAQHHEMQGELIVVEEDEFDMTEVAVEASDEVDLGEDAEFTVAVSNDQLDEIETTVSLEIGEEAFTEDVAVAGGETEEVTFVVDAVDLGEGEHDWTVTVDGEEEDSGSVTVDGEEDGSVTVDGEEDGSVTVDGEEDGSVTVTGDPAVDEEIRGGA